MKNEEIKSIIGNTSPTPFTNRAKYSMNFEIGSYHWFNTLMSHVNHIGEYITTHKENTKPENLKEWGKVLQNVAKDMVEWKEKYPQTIIENEKLKSMNIILMEGLREALKKSIYDQNTETWSNLPDPIIINKVKELINKS